MIFIQRSFAGNLSSLVSVIFYVMINKIAFIGNCQNFGSAYYFHKLYPDVEMMIFFPERYRNKLWYEQIQVCLGLSEFISEDCEEFSSFLSDCDVVCSSNISSDHCSFCNCESIKSHLKEDCRYYMLGGINYTGSAFSKQQMQGKSNSWQCCNNDSAGVIDCRFICPCSLLDEFSHKELIQSEEEEDPRKTSTQASPLFYMEILRKFCLVEDIPFFNEVDYNKLNEFYFPYNMDYVIKNAEIASS